MNTPTQRLMRSQSDKLIAGVAGGIAAYVHIDATLVRLAFVALGFMGFGLLLYPLLWLIMPREGGKDAVATQAFDEIRQQAQRVSDEVREVFVVHGSAPRRPRYDPMTGVPLEPEADIPINNINMNSSATSEAQLKRNQLLGLILLGAGGFLLLAMIPGLAPVIARFLIPAALIGAGVYLVWRSRSR